MSKSRFFGREMGGIGWGGLVGVVLGALACNGVTGADRLVLVGDMDDEESAADGAVGGAFSASGQGGAATVGKGGAGSVGGAQGVVASSAVGSSVTSTSGAATTVASSSSMASSTTGPTNCQYPPGPYGFGYGDTVSPSLSWQGYAPGATQAQTVTVAMDQFHDCDGTLGIHALAIETSQFG